MWVWRDNSPKSVSHITIVLLKFRFCVCAETLVGRNRIG